jgi:hypothetical protein
MLERISVASIFITCNGGQLRCLFPERLPEAWRQARA